jgi:hypothetical protein
MLLLLDLLFIDHSLLIVRNFYKLLFASHFPILILPHIFSLFLFHAHMDCHMDYTFFILLKLTMARRKRNVPGCPPRENVS